MTTVRAFKEIGVENKVVRANNGEEALGYLKGQGNKKPCIILLDLNMPKMNGLELMQNLKTNDALKSIPVIILTTSKQEEDRDECFRLNAAGYMVKRPDYDQFVEMVEIINRYWTLSELPNGDKE
jgi:CheY-like chemotaxis protein